MAKKKKGKVLQMLSPENYIRKKARTLPLYECWINSDWEDSQMVQILLARKHTNGNITVCLYLVDLLCLGIKDSHYLFNISETKYREQIYNISEQMEFERCEYSLIHNIIFAGLEFAEEFGFKPHKGFTSVTKYMLEEDTDEIELIEIECGENGKPVYMKGPFDSDTKAHQIIKQLEKKAGLGNFEFVDDLDDELDELWDEEFDEHDLDFENKYERLSITEKLALFKASMARLEELNNDEKIDFGDLVESIIGNYLDRERADEIYDLYFDKLDFFEITNELSDEIIPSKNLLPEESTKLKSQFAELYDLIINDSALAEKKLKPLVKKFTDNPAICFLELTYLRLHDFEKYKSKQKEYSKKFPDYALLRLLNQINNYVEKTLVSNGLSIDGIIDTYFPDRKVLHRIEIFHVFLFMFVYATKTKNIELLDALDFLMEESYLQEQEIDLLEYFVTMGKFEFILSLLKKE